MSQVLLFSSSLDSENKSLQHFNNFPLRKLNFNTTVILDYGFQKHENEHFIKELTVRGFRLIEVTEPKNLERLKIINIAIKEKIDSSELEFGKHPILYYNPETGNTEITYLCKNCKEECSRKNFPISFNMKEPQFCSDKCILESSETETDFSIGNKILEVDPKNPIKDRIEGLSGKKPHTFIYMKDSDNRNYDDRNDKFQDTMRKEAIRLEYAERREKYKKQMRQISTRKSNTKSVSLKKELSRTVSTNNSKCKAKTKKGTLCGNRTQPGTEFCGISSHQLFSAKEKAKNESKNESKASKNESKASKNESKASKNESKKETKVSKKIKQKTKPKEIKI